MFDCISDKTNIALYADDTKIWREIIVWDDHLALQNDIDNLLRWANVNKMTFHPQKCKVVSVAKNSHKIKRGAGPLPGPEYRDPKVFL